MVSHYLVQEILRVSSFQNPETMGRKGFILLGLLLILSVLCHSGEWSRGVRVRTVRHPWPHASSFLGLRETELMSLASAWLWFSCLPMLHIQGCVTKPSYVTALPSVERLPELQLFWVTALFSRGMGQGGTLSRLSFAPLIISCWGHHL